MPVTRHARRASADGLCASEIEVKPDDVTEGPDSGSTLVVFSHGLESGPWGRKITALADVARAFHMEVVSLDYRQLMAQGSKPARGVEAERRVQQILSAPLGKPERLILVGSSMGGYVSATVADRLRAHGLFLLAPALYLQDLPTAPEVTSVSHIEVVHGWSDDVIPWEHSARFCERHRCALHIVPGDHRLNDSLPRIIPLFADFLRGFEPSTAQHG
jgi:acetyl esterase/lipase